MYEIMRNIRSDDAPLLFHDTDEADAVWPPLSESGPSVGFEPQPSPLICRRLFLVFY